MSIDELLREAAQRGGLTGLTIYPTTGGWMASRRREDRSAWNVHIRPDPVTALRAALGELPAPLTGAFS